MKLWIAISTETSPRLGILVFLTLSIFACSPISGPEAPTETPSPLLETAALVVPTSTSLPRSPTSVIALTQEPEPTEVPSITPTQEIQEGDLYLTCQNSASLVPNDFSIDGAIVYVDNAQGVYASLGGNPVIESQLPLPGEEDDYWQTYTMDFSPDGGWLAFVYSSGERFTAGPPFKENRFGLLSAQGDIIENELDFASLEARIPEGSFLDSWLSARWINQELVLASFAYRFPDEPPSLLPVLSILDPFQGVWLQEMLESLPDADLTIAPTFSPDLRRVLYQRDSREQVLWDRETNAVLWTGSAYYFRGEFRLEAQWSPDNSMLALKAWEDSDANIDHGGSILLIDRDDSARTHIAKGIFEALPTDSYRISQLSWSSDSQLLAFVVREFNKLDFLQTIYVYDVTAKRIVYRCPLSPLEEAGITYYWSPDSRYIAYTYYRYSPIILLDILSEEAFQLAENAILVGWSDKFPKDWQASE